jgi:hypothetical protein
MIKHPITSTNAGDEVFVDLIKSPAGITISRQPHIVNLAKELLRTVNPKKRNATIEFDLGRNIGNCEIVETTDKDYIIYAKPVRQSDFRRFVRRRNPEQTSFITITLHHHSDGSYELYDAWFGRNVPGLPGSETETDASKTFWENHAIVLDGYPLQNQTITTTCPY